MNEDEPEWEERPLDEARVPCAVDAESEALEEKLMPAHERRLRLIARLARKVQGD